MSDVWLYGIDYVLNGDGEGVWISTTTGQPSDFAEWAKNPPEPIEDPL